MTAWSSQRRRPCRNDEGMHSKRIRTQVGGLKVCIESFRWTLPAFRQIGGCVVVAAGRGERRQREFSVDLVNFYFVAGTPPLESGGPDWFVGDDNLQRKKSAGQRRTLTRRICVGFGRASALFPCGVTSIATVTVGDECRTFVTSAGIVPHSFAVEKALLSSDKTSGFAICTPDLRAEQ